MQRDRRAVWWLVACVVVVPLAGCATRGSVQTLKSDVAALQARVDETNRALSQTVSTVNQTVAAVKETDAGLSRQVRQAEGLGQRMGKLEERLQDVEGAVKGVKAAVDTLSTQVARLVGRPSGGAESAEQLYASALGHYQAANLGQAVLEFSDLVASFPDHPLAEQSQFWIGAAYFAEQDFRQALVEFRKVVDRYPRGTKVPDALYRLGLSYRSLFETDRAREVWARLIRDFPTSDAARIARTALRARAPSPSE